MGIVTSILKRPSQRTQMEATLTGLTVIMLTSLGTAIYLVFFTDSNVWIKVLSGLGGFALFLMLFSNLSLTYIQYHAFKLAMGLYPTDKKLLMKLEEAKIIKKELEELIKENEQETLTKNMEVIK